MRAELQCVEISEDDSLSFFIFPSPSERNRVNGGVNFFGKEERGGAVDREPHRIRKRDSLIVIFLDMRIIG